MHTRVEVGQGLRALLVIPHGLERDVEDLAVVDDLLLEGLGGIGVGGVRRGAEAVDNEEELGEAFDAGLEFGPLFGLGGR